MTMPHFEKPTWEPHPNYQPIDLASQRRLVESWSGNQRISFAAMPVATLALSELDREHLHQEVLLGGGWFASGKDAAHLKDMADIMEEERPTEKTKDIITSYVAALQEIAEHDRLFSEAPELSISSTEVELRMYSDKGVDSSWHCDAFSGTARARNAVKYAVALIGESTIFSGAGFARMDYDSEAADMLPESYPDTSLTYQPRMGVVMRFNGVTPHRAPHQPLAPRLFASITFHNKQLPH